MWIRNRTTARWTLQPEIRSLVVLCECVVSVVVRCVWASVRCDTDDHVYDTRTTDDAEACVCVCTM